MAKNNDGINELPDGSGFFTASYPLPKDHWIYQETGEPPMPFQTGVGQTVECMYTREQFLARVEAAARYAIKGATMSGKQEDFDPDALIQNLCVGMCGYFTVDGSESAPIVKVTKDG